MQTTLASWQPLSKVAPLLGISHQKLWRRLDYWRHHAPYAPGAPQINIHWRFDFVKNRYLINTAKLEEVKW